MTPYYRLPDMTIRQAWGVWWYNNLLRHYHNWRVRRMWCNDINRPSLCPRASALTPAAMRWALDHSYIDNED